MGLLSIIWCIINPRESLFLGDLIPADYYSYYPWGILVCIFHIPLIILLCLSTATTCSFGMLFYYYLLHILTQELRIGQQHYKTVDALRQPEQLTKTFIMLRIIHKYFELTIGRLLLFLHMMMTIGPVLAMFLLIAFSGRLRFFENALLFVSAVSPTFLWIFTLQVGNYLFVRGNKTVNSWRFFDLSKSRREVKSMQKFRRCCKPLLLCYGKTFKVERITQFVYVKGIVRGVFRLLLTFPKN